MAATKSREGRRIVLGGRGGGDGPADRLHRLFTGAAPGEPGAKHEGTRADGHTVQEIAPCDRAIHAQIAIPFAHGASQDDTLFGCATFE